MFVFFCIFCVWSNFCVSYRPILILYKYHNSYKWRHGNDADWNESIADSSRIVDGVGKSDGQIVSCSKHQNSAWGGACPFFGAEVCELFRDVDGGGANGGFYM